jgi:xanthine dehydrogenase accessory factor
MKRGVLEALQEARAAGRAVAVAFPVEGPDEARLVAPEGPDPLAEAAREALRTDVARTVEDARGTWLVRPYAPPLRLVVVGAVHVAGPLSTMARAVGYRVVVVDPRAAFATVERFPDDELRRDWPDEALRALAPDARTAVVTLTHDPKLDDPALREALRTPAFYVGALGSRRTHAARLERLGAAGVPASELTRIHGPVGLAIGARSPAEIAVSILAEMTAVLRGRAPGGSGVPR